VDRVFDALVTATATDVTRHRFANLIVVGFCIFDQQGCGLHDLTGLAISALWNIELAPGLLHRVIPGGMKTFDCRNFPVDGIGNRGDAGANGLLVEHNGACPAQSLAAAVFRARQAGLIAEKPKQREIRVAVPILLLAIDFYFDHVRSSLFLSC
jgi:hypothetical protein